MKTTLGILSILLGVAVGPGCDDDHDHGEGEHSHAEGDQNHEHHGEDEGHHEEGEAHHGEIDESELPPPAEPE